MAAPPPWLSEAEQSTWRAFLLTWQLLDEALDRQLQRDAGLTHAHYAILVTLSEAPDGAARMRRLAARLRFSESRMTHAVDSLAARGWVRRERAAEDRRGQRAVLTPAGRRALAAAAPGHVAEVRARVFDHLTGAQAAQLHDICRALLGGLDRSAPDVPVPPA